MPFEVKATPEPDIANSSDEQLFVEMQAANHDPLKATNAWREFYRRYRDYLWQSCLTFCKTVAEGKELAKDIFQTTILKLFEEAGSFKPSENRGIKAWISRIAFNEFIDHYNKYNKKFIPYDDPPDVVDNQEEELTVEEELFDEKMSNLKTDQLATLLKHLKPRELKVLMITMSHYQIDNPLAHLPDLEMKKLCEEFSVKPETIRQIKLRALNKLKRLAKELFT